jgi:hypothetical protein
MTDAEELAERYLTLWTQYLTALLADPRAVETLKRWTAFASRFSYPDPGTTQASATQPSGGAAPFPAWPPFFGPFAPPPASTPAPDGLDALARRVDALERRLAALEHPQKPRRARRGTSAGGR